MFFKNIAALNSHNDIHFFFYNTCKIENHGDLKTCLSNQTWQKQ